MIPPGKTRVMEGLFLKSAKELADNLNRGGKSAFVSKEEKKEIEGMKFALGYDNLIHAIVRLGEGSQDLIDNVVKEYLVSAEAGKLKGKVFFYPMELIEFFRVPIQSSRSLEELPFVGKIELLRKRIISARYLVEPYASYVIDGRKSLIISNIYHEAYLDRPVYLFTTRNGSQLALGVIQLSLPKEINLEDFRKLRKKHLITEADRKRWWKGERTLWAYPVKVIEKYEIPLAVRFRRGPQIWVTDFEFIHRSNATISSPPALKSFYLRRPGVNIVGAIANWGQTAFDIDVCLMMGYCGSLWPSVKNAIVRAIGEKFIRQFHIFPNIYYTPFTNYYEVLDFKVEAVNEEIQREDLAPIYPIHEDAPKTRMYDLLDSIHTEVIEEDFIFRDGLQFWVRAEGLPPDFIVPLEFRVYRQLPKELWPQISFHYSLDYPPEEYQHVYRFILEKRDPAIRVQMDLKRARLEPKAEKQAEKAKRTDKITMFEFFYPLKSAVASLVGYRLAEYYNVDAMLNYLSELAKRKKLKTEIPVSFIEKKYD